MGVPASLASRLKLPAMAAPMFLVSGPDLVVEACRSGVIGTFPALNQRTSEGYEAWLEEIAERLSAAPGAAPFGVNLIVNRSNSRLQADLEISVKHKVPIIITSLGAASDVVDAVHAYGGLVFHDVISVRHARKAAEAGVDGIIAVCAGAGGHGGPLSPFALIPEIRSFFDGTIVLSGAQTSGAHVAAARVMGADLGYIGTRFINVKESLADDHFKQMIIDAHASDIIYTPRVSGVYGNFLKPSIVEAGFDPDSLEAPHNFDMDHEASKLRGEDGEKQAWKTVLSAGQGVGSIDDVPGTAELCARLIEEYRAAMRRCADDPFAG